MTSLRPRCLLFLSLLFLVLCGHSPAVAQEDADDIDAEKPIVREQTIYVPFGELRDVFEKEGRGVFLPYDQFQKLWEAARSAETLEPNANLAAKPPVDAIITEATSEATVRKDVVQVEATLVIELLRSGWNTVPLRLGDAAIQSATIEDQVARVTSVAGGGYQLVVENTTKKPKRVELKLTYVRAFNKSPGQNSVSFAAPQTPVNRWRIRIPGSGVKVNVTPMIAASEVEENEEEETVLLAFVGSAPEVAIRWTAKSEGASGLTALTSVQAAQEVYLSEGSVRTRSTLTYSISRAQIEQLIIEVPADQKVVSVFDANVRKWDVEAADDKQTITVDLFEPATSSQGLTIELEKFVDESTMKEVHAPMIRSLGVARQQGVVVVRADPALRAESTTREGLLQVDASELPAALANQNWTFAYRYASMPFDLGIAVEKIKPRINVQQLVEYYLEPEQMSLETFIVYDIEQAGVFQLELGLPLGYEVQQVRGKEVDGGTAAVVDSFHTEGDNKERLIINLARKAMGKIGLAVQLQKKVADPNLLSPTGVASSIELPIPEANQLYRNHFAGKLIVYAPESLRLNPTTTTGLRAISFSEAFDPVASCREGRYASTRPSLAFAFSEQAVDLQLDVERRSPYVTARQLMVARIDSGIVKYDCTLLYEILYSGVKSLRVDLPSSVASNIRNVSDGIRDTVMEPQPDDVFQGYVAWKMTGEIELLGTQRIKFTWDQEIDVLAVGKSVDFVVPRVTPIGVDRAWGQIVVTKTETLDVQPTGEPEGLRPIDPVHDLMPDAKVADAAAAMEFHDAWSLTLRATRYQLEEVKRTSIERALVRTVVTRSDHRTVQALYRVRSARQRLSVKLPADTEFDSQPARVNGSPVSLERGDQDMLYIPLIGQDPNSEFVLELRYTVPGDHKRITIPEFPEDPAIQKVYLAVFLPEELSLLNTSGPWTEEFEWRHLRPSQWKPLANRTDDELESWVSEGIAAGRGPAFQKDGTLYLFSALRPDAPPTGSLRLLGVNENTLSIIVITVLVAIGLLLLRSSFTQKLMAIVLLIIGAVLCGLMAPTLGRQLLNTPTYAGLVIVVFAWLVWTLYHAEKRNSLKRAGNENVARPPDFSEVKDPDGNLADEKEGDHHE